MSALARFVPAYRAATTKPTFTKAWVLVVPVLSAALLVNLATTTATPRVTLTF